MKWAAAIVLVLSVFSDTPHAPPSSDLLKAIAEWRSCHLTVMWEAKQAADLDVMKVRLELQFPSAPPPPRMEVVKAATDSVTALLERYDSQYQRVDAAGERLYTELRKAGYQPDLPLPDCPT